MPKALTDFLLAPYHIVGDMIAAGGPFVVWIFICGLVLWTLVIERYWYFSRVLPRQAEEMLKVWKARADVLSSGSAFALLGDVIRNAASIERGEPEQVSERALGEALPL